MGNKYACYGRVFEVREARPGVWHADGRKRGIHPYVLDRIGTSHSREEMQRQLDRWADNMGLLPLETKTI